MRSISVSLAAVCAAVTFSACSGNEPTLAPQPKSTTVAPTAPTAAPSTSAPSTVPTTAPTVAPSSPSGPGYPTTAPVVTPTPTAVATAQPQVVHIGFNHATTDDPTFGDVSYYTPTSGADDPAEVVHVAAGSKIVFTSDAGSPSHTASGLGSSGFPTSFDNTGGTTATGSTIDGGTTWSTGTLAAGQSSAAFTVGPAGDYYFGCFYHYNDASMRDVIVSM